MKKLFIGCAIAALATPAVYAQETTSSIRGMVDAGGAPVASATVTIRHEPSGTSSTQVTGPDGGFAASGLRVGGPFTVTVTADGYPEAKVTELFLTAGQPLRVPVSLDAGQEIVVTGATSRAVELSTGPISSFDREKIEGVASVSRDIRDIARRDAFVTIDQSNSRALEIAGQNGRLNKFSVDGVRFSDNFGLNNGGLPTSRGPVPLDAIEQLSVKVAPYDVTEGDFQGGAINVVLRAGGNQFHGSGFYTYTDDSLTGDKQGKAATAANPQGRINLDFKSRNYGGFLSGPIVQDKLFFAVSYEYLKESRPADTGLEGFANVVPNITQAQVDQVSSIAQSLYGYDTLGLYDSVVETDEKYTARIDWNVTDDHRASFTYIHNEGIQGNPQGSNSAPASPALGLASNAYVLGEKVDSGVFQLNSDWSSNFSTEVRAFYRKTDRSQEAIGDKSIGQFTVCLDPSATVGQSGAAGSNSSPTVCSQGNAAAPGTGRIIFGPDPSRHSNVLSYKNYGGSFAANWTYGDHSLKATASYSRLEVFNIFLQNTLGTYYFDSLADFQNRRAGSLTLTGALSGNINDAAAIYGYQQYTFGLQDSWDVTDTLNLTFGARYDLYGGDDRPALNNNFVARYGFPNTETYSGKGVFQPRFGMTWEASDRLTIRGGVGLFAGGSPDVWLSNSFQNPGATANTITIQRTNLAGTVGGTGCNQTDASLCAAALDNVDGSNFDALANLLRGDPNSVALANVNLISPDFKIPSTWKASLSATYEADLGPLGDDWLFGGDLYYGWTNNAPNYTDLRSKVIGSLPDGRPRYGPVTAATNNSDYLLFNTSKGTSLVAVAKIDKVWDFGLTTGIAYTFQDIEDVNPTTSSTASSNYGNSAMADPNFSLLGTSFYQIRHSFKFTFDYEHEFFGDNKTRFSLFAERRSGRPYSLTMTDTTSGRSAVFGTVGANNRYLLYVPNVASINADPAVSYDSVATFTAFQNFVQSKGLKQGIVGKNTFRSPQYTKVDLHIDQEIPLPLLPDGKLVLFADLENVLNLIDSDWGAQRQVNFPQFAPIVNVACLSAAAASTTGVSGTGSTGVATNSGQQCAQYRYSNFQNPVFALQNQNRQSLWGLRIGAKVKF